MSANLKPPLAFSYLRFSTPEQQRGDSFRRQTELAQRYAREHGLVLDSRSFADLGVSAFRGANLQSGKLGEFLHAVQIGAIPKGSYLLMESLDRMSRADPWDSVGELRKIVKAGIRVVTLTNGRVYEIDDTNSEFALLEAVVVLIRAHEESVIKSRRLKAAWEKKRGSASSRPITSIAPAWLRSMEDGNGFEALEDRAAVVRGIFEAYLGGEGPHSIAQRLNKEGVQPFGRGEFWHRSYVLKILDNPATIGEFTPHTLEYDEGGRRTRKPQPPLRNYFPAIIGAEDFARVRSLRSSKRSPAQPAGTRRVSHLLAGLAQCPHCRSSMLRVNKGGGPKGGYPYLVCSRAKAGAGCQYHGVRIDRIEPRIVEAYEHLARDMPVGSKTVEDVAKRLEKEREALTKRIARYVEFLEVGPSEAVRTELSKAEESLARVRTEERELAAIRASRNVVSRTARLSDLRKALSRDPLDYAEANAALRQLFGRVVVHWDRAALDFHWQHGGVSRVTVVEETW
ncbi:recombinase family protein [Nitratireductor pacificus]|uniref:Recombinase n=1 Tax=Nitratireductor pacificus pht-3B TaxID=391937 RepID=K2MXY7_9HYPH|nr:recombinase family protein [Nitratireductor pacificus]EKF16858.1 recombinase [Nitratireductor pacificus pht-3B]